MSVVISIDPGVTGAIALHVNRELFTVEDMPTFTKELTTRTKKGNLKKRKEIDRAGLLDILHDFAGHCEPKTTPTVVIEIQGPRDSNGVVQAFSTGCGFGVLMGLMTALGWVTVYVRPGLWKSDLGLSADKIESLEMARQVWPGRLLFDRAKDDGRAEAALIGAWWHIHRSTS